MGQIFTRYQPQGCRKNPAKEQPPCSNATSMARFENFEFHWNAQTESAMKSLPSAIREDDLVCGVGWRHTRRVSEFVCCLSFLHDHLPADTEKHSILLLMHIIYFLSLTFVTFNFLQYKFVQHLASQYTYIHVLE